MHWVMVNQSSQFLWYLDIIRKWLFFASLRVSINCCKYWLIGYLGKTWERMCLIGLSKRANTNDTWLQFAFRQLWICFLFGKCVQLVVFGGDVNVACLSLRPVAAACRAASKQTAGLLGFPSGFPTICRGLHGMQCCCGDSPVNIYFHFYCKHI